MVTEINQLFPDGDPDHVNTSPLTCYACQWTGFYMKRTSVMKELKEVQRRI